MGHKLSLVPGALLFALVALSSGDSVFADGARVVCGGAEVKIPNGDIVFRVENVSSRGGGRCLPALLVGCQTDLDCEGLGGLCSLEVLNDHYGPPLDPEGRGGGAAQD